MACVARAVLIALDMLRRLPDPETQIDTDYRAVCPHPEIAMVQVISP
jgi:hypothetical protein